MDSYRDMSGQATGGSEALLRVHSATCYFPRRASNHCAACGRSTFSTEDTMSTRFEVDQLM